MPLPKDSPALRLRPGQGARSSHTAKGSFPITSFRSRSRCVGRINPRTIFDRGSTIRRNRRTFESCSRFQKSAAWCFTWGVRLRWWWLLLLVRWKNTPSMQTRRLAAEWLVLNFRPMGRV